MKDHFVVFFDEFVSVVPTTWIEGGGKNNNKKIVYWPRGPSCHKKQMILKSVESNWNQFEYHKLLGPFDYDTALKVEKGCTTADTDEDSDELVQAIVNGSNTIPLKKRSAQSQQFTKDSEGSCTDDEDELRQPTLPKFSKSPLPQYVLNGNKNIKTEPKENNFSENYERSITEKLESMNGVKDSLKDNLIHNTVENKSNDQILIDNSFEQTHCSNSMTCKAFIDTSRKEKPVITNVEEVRYEFLDLNNIGNAFKEINVKKSCMCCDGNRSCPWELINPTDLLTESKFKIYFNQLIRKINKLAMEKHGNIEDNEEDNSLLPPLPLQTIDDINNFNDVLQNSTDAKRQLKKKIQSLGGKSEKDCTSRAMLYIMTYDVGKIMSWSGQRNTHKFGGTNICNTLIDAVMQMSTLYKRDKCEEKIKSWLQHASEKLKKKNL